MSYIPLELWLIQKKVHRILAGAGYKDYYLFQKMFYCIFKKNI